MHYIDVNANVEFQSTLLDCVELAFDQYTAIDITSAMVAYFMFWNLTTDNINCVTAAVSDNGANNVKVLNEHLHIPIVVICFAHTVNLTVEKGFKSCCASPLLAKV